MVKHGIAKGRPAGSKTKGDTPGKKRAREFFEFKYATKSRPTRAAEVIATKFGVETFSIFKDAKRHEAALAEEEWEEAEQLRRKYEDRLYASIGPQMPSDPKIMIPWVFKIVFSKQWLG